MKFEKIIMTQSNTATSRALYVSRVYSNIFILGC